MKEQKTDDEFSRLVCSLNLSGLTGTKIILWLLAITIVSFAIGFGILAITGALAPSAGHSGSPFIMGSMAAKNTTTFALEGAAAGTVQITMGAGELLVHGGAPPGSIMESGISGTAPEWQPEYSQSAAGGVMTIIMTDPGRTESGWFSLDPPKRWEVALAEDLPLELAVKLGAGDCTLELGGLNLSGLSLDAGTGEAIVDLGRYHGGAFSGRIDQGIGDLTVRIPRESNTRVVIDQGVGDIRYYGLVMQGKEYTTRGFDPANPAITILIDQGVGDIRLEAVP
jgi:hypothetical protein